MTPRRAQQLLHVGIRSSVVALDAATGAEVWRRPLKGGAFVHVVRRGELLFAANQGEVWCLDAASGEVRWHNPMKGLGLGLVSLATEGEEPEHEREFISVAEQLRRQEQARQASSSAG